MPRKGFEELRLDTLKEGRYLATAETDFRRVVKAMVEFAANHPGDAEGAKGKLTLEVEVGCTKGGGFFASAVSKIKLPGRPAMIAWPTPEQNDLGEPSLFIQNDVQTTNPVPGNEAPETSEG